MRGNGGPKGWLVAGGVRNCKNGKEIKPLIIMIMIIIMIDSEVKVTMAGGAFVFTSRTNVPHAFAPGTPRPSNCRRICPVRRSVVVIGPGAATLRRRSSVIFCCSAAARTSSDDGSFVYLYAVKEGTVSEHYKHVLCFCFFDFEEKRRSVMLCCQRDELSRESAEQRTR